MLPSGRKTRKFCPWYCPSQLQEEEQVRAETREQGGKQREGRGAKRRANLLALGPRKKVRPPQSLQERMPERVLEERVRSQGADERRGGKIPQQCKGGGRILWRRRAGRRE
eukprot:753800-Hanusia_phi.AAC.4